MKIKRYAEFIKESQINEFDFNPEFLNFQNYSQTFNEIYDFLLKLSDTVDGTTKFHVKNALKSLSKAGITKQDLDKLKELFN
jgi:hypothetical protein